MKPDLIKYLWICIVAIQLFYTFKSANDIQGIQENLMILQKFYLECDEKIKSSTSKQENLEKFVGKMQDLQESYSQKMENNNNNLFKSQKQEISSLYKLQNLIFKQLEILIESQKIDHYNLNGLNQTLISIQNAQNILEIKNQNLEIQINSRFQIEFPPILESISEIKLQSQEVRAEITSMGSLGTQINQLNQIIKDILPNIDQISIINNEIDQLFAFQQSQKDSIKILGPFHYSNHEQIIYANNIEFKIYQTTEPCIFNLEARYLVIATATGHGMADTWAQLIFMIDRTVQLDQQTDSTKWLYGSQMIKPDMLPINYVQIFIVEPGLHELTLGLGSDYSSTKITLHEIGISVTLKRID